MENKTRRIIITNGKTQEQWITEFKPKPDNDDEGQFVAAYFIQRGSDKEEPMDPPGTGGLEIINCNEINRKKMKEAFEAQTQPATPQTVVRTTIRNKLYCLPYYGPDMTIKGYKCYGVGTLTCQW